MRYKYSQLAILLQPGSGSGTKRQRYKAARYSSRAPAGSA